MKISNRNIGAKYPPYFIAEMSNNHLGDIDKAKKIIESAKLAGADAVKIQTYDADSLTIDCKKSDFKINDPLWKDYYYYDLYKEISAPKDWTYKLFEFAKKLDITLFSSPFDFDSVDLLETCDCPAYKIASFESQDPYLVKRISETGKPVIFSTGVSNFDEIRDTVNWIKNCDNNNYAILHCISSYPSQIKDMNVNVIKRLASISDVVGLSDHSLSNIAVLTSISMGANIIEKHFTLNRDDGGPDSDFSLEPHEFKEMKKMGLEVWDSLGSSDVLESSERAGTQHARSIYIVEDIKKGECLTNKNTRIIRPGFGMKPKYYSDVIGKIALYDIERGSALSWKMFQ